MLRIIFATGAITASIVALCGTASATANCPGWTSPKCVQYSCTGPLIGGKCTCVRYQCVADKKSDPHKSIRR